MNSVNVANFRSRTFEVNLVVDTSIYASGDVLSDRVAITLDANAVTESKKLSGTITGITLLDKADQGSLLDLVVLDADVSLGTINVAPTITDTNAERVVAIVPVTNYTDLGGNQVARPSFDPIDFETSTGKVYLGAICRGTPTYGAASDLRAKISIQLHNINK
jgi:hypothetical protein